MSEEGELKVEDVQLVSVVNDKGSTATTVDNFRVEVFSSPLTSKNGEGEGSEVKADNQTNTVVVESVSIVEKPKDDIKEETRQEGVESENGEVPSDPAPVDQNKTETVKLTLKKEPRESNVDWTIKRDGAVRLKVGNDPNHISSVQPVTVMEILEETSEKYPDVTAMKIERNGEWISWSYRQYRNDVHAVAKAFIKLGLQPFNSVGILGFNSPEWFLADLGAIYAGGLACGIYTTNSPSACQFQVNDAQVEILVAENQGYADKIIPHWDKMPGLKAVVIYSGEIKNKTKDIYSLSEIIEMGRKEPNDLLLERTRNQTPNSCCTLIYTSGTTGTPKGVMLSHDNLVFGTKHVLKTMDGVLQYGGQEHVISYLPLSHIAAQEIDIFCPIITAGTVWFARPDALKGSLSETLKTVRPTLFFGVPRVYEKIEDRIKTVARNVTGIKKKMGDWAKSVALRGNINKEYGRSVPYGWTLATMFLKKPRAMLGLDRCKMAVVGAAPVQLSTMRYFQSLNIPLCELYGMSECGGSNLGVPGSIRTPSVGKACSGIEMKVINQDENGSGEICMYGRTVFMGYLNNEEKTVEALDDENWLHSGDVGKFDEDGFLYITGRIKELIITAGAENIAPVPIEDNIKAELPIISNAMVVGDKKKFLSVLLSLKTQMHADSGEPLDELMPVVTSYCASLGITATKLSELTGNVPEALRNAIQQGLDKANEKAISRAAKVQKWHLLEKDFSLPGGELGPTLKVRRPQVHKMYKETIDGFYEE